MQTTVLFSDGDEHVNHEVQFERSAFEIGRALLHEALFGTGELELYPLVVDEGALVVNGARLVEHSARFFCSLSTRGAGCNRQPGVSVPTATKLR